MSRLTLIDATSARLHGQLLRSGHCSSQDGVKENSVKGDARSAVERLTTRLCKVNEGPGGQSRGEGRR